MYSHFPDPQDSGRQGNRRRLGVGGAIVFSGRGRFPGVSFSPGETPHINLYLISLL